MDPHNPWSEFLTAVGYTIRSTYHITLEATLAQLVFGRDMLLPMTFEANWTGIQQNHQKEMNCNNEQENKSRIAHVYTVGDKVSLDKPVILQKMSNLDRALTKSSKYLLTVSS